MPKSCCFAFYKLKEQMINFLKTVGEMWLRVLHTQTQHLARQHRQQDTDRTGLLTTLLTEVTLVLIEPFKGCKLIN